jgi:hypothetical protein
MLVAALLVAIVTGVPAAAQEQETPPQESGLSIVEGDTGQETLESLQNRSAEKRWNKLSKLWKKNRSKGKNSLQAVPDGNAVSTSDLTAPQRLDAQTIQPVPEQLPLDEPEVARDFSTETSVQVVRSTQPPTEYVEPVRDPRQLRKVTEILPFYDYQPDIASLSGDPCQYLCPRPDSPECEPDEAGAKLPTCPDEVQLSSGLYEGRLIAESVFSWEPSNLYHNPLYFEDGALERYGHTRNKLIQPFYSVAKFGGQLFGLPYQMAIDPACRKQYTLGWYRPGECAPKKCYQIPWSFRAAAAQAGVLTGIFFVFP